MHRKATRLHARYTLTAWPLHGDCTSHCTSGALRQEGKATAHVDVALLAELAEEAGIDLRVVSLTRELASAARSRMQPNATATAAKTTLAAGARLRSDGTARWPHLDGDMAR